MRVRPSATMHHGGEEGLPLMMRLSPSLVSPPKRLVPCGWPSVEDSGLSQVPEMTIELIPLSRVHRPEHSQAAHHLTRPGIIPAVQVHGAHESIQDASLLMPVLLLLPRIVALITAEMPPFIMMFSRTPEAPAIQPQ